MFASQTWMRRALLAALIAVPLPVLAELAARFDPVSGAVVVTGLEGASRAALLANPELLRLQVASIKSTRGMPITLQDQGTTLVIEPRFDLRPGTVYMLDLNGTALEIVPPIVEATVPRLVGFAPSQAVIPANTLRLYLHFSEPMARGQLREAVVLIGHDGTEVPSPFLNLEVELWDPTQTRATLLLDPGRIKQGVGPNTQGGAPLMTGEAYRLVVSEAMQSAAGAPLGQEASVAFRVGDAERSAIVPDDWQILPPPVGSHAPVTVAFDRIIDSGAVLRLLTVEDPQGAPVRGQIETDGGAWSLIPNQPWQDGTYRVIVDPELEDVSGNSISAAFDAAVGTIGTNHAPVTLTFNITQ
ncbi:Ig-like domain-containing protein [Thalassobius sp. MITS945101]|uniref:Ig-like domain-containing protein n=1 Tax=Thalassobius sp. MITS945101 TaxID=3096994 RepID=UPI00399B8365